MWSAWREKTGHRVRSRKKYRGREWGAGNPLGLLNWIMPTWNNTTGLTLGNSAYQETLDWPVYMVYLLNSKLWYPWYTIYSTSQTRFKGYPGCCYSQLPAIFCHHPLKIARVILEKPYIVFTYTCFPIAVSNYFPSNQIFFLMDYLLSIYWWRRQPSV